MNIVNLIIFALIAILVLVVGGVIYIAIRASRRRPGGVTPEVGIDLSFPLKLSLLVGFVLIALYHSAITGWFVSEETVNALGRWLSPVFWIGIIGAISSAITLFNLRSALATGGTFLGASQARFGRLLLFVAFGGIIFLLFFTELSVRIIEWDWSATPAGSIADDTFGEWANLVMWLLFALAALMIYRIARPKKQKNVVGQHVSVGDQLFGLFGLGIVGVIALGVLVLVLGIGDVFTGGQVGRIGDRFLAAFGVIDLDPPSTVACGQLNDRYGDTLDPRIGYDYVVVNICPGDGRQYFRVVQTGHTGLDIGFHQSALNEHGPALFTRSIYEFVTVTNAGATSYYGYVNPTPFADLGVDHLKIVVRALP